MRVIVDRRAGDASRIDQRCVVERIAEHDPALADECGREPEVRHVPGGEEERSLAAG
jgi:hypothetical protein